MGIAAIAIAAGCVFAGVVLIASAIVQWRSDVTLSGRGGPSGPISRLERPWHFWYLFWARVVLDLVAVVAGAAGLAHLS